MSNLSITQSYALCALNSDGKFPTFSMEIPVCLVAGSIIDLILENNIVVLDKKLNILSPLNSKSEFLQSIYDFIWKNNDIKLDALASNFCFSLSNKKISALINDVCKSLVEKKCVALQHGGLLGKKELFIPDESCVDGVVQMIRAEILEDGALSDEIVALTSLLEKSGMLKKYFSSYEKKLLKTRIDEIKNSPSHKIVGELVDYVTVMYAVIASV